MTGRRGPRPSTAGLAYKVAGDIARCAMGPIPKKDQDRGTKCAADADPLAWVCLTELLLTFRSASTADLQRMAARRPA